MGSPVQNPPPGFEGLSIDEKIEYVQSLWDHIASDVETVPLADWQKQVLDERLKDLEENPEAGIPWSEIRAGVLRKLGKRGA
jgi:putative addiction module component (TIGR02574 family)